MAAKGKEEEEGLLKRWKKEATPTRGKKGEGEEPLAGDPSLATPKTAGMSIGMPRHHLTGHHHR